MAKKKKEITSRVIRQSKETKRAFKELVWKLEDTGVTLSPDEIADFSFQKGIYNWLNQL
jgi:hypothetical protein